MQLSTLFTPFAINDLEIQNRISMPAMGLNYATGGQVNERLIQFYARRAKGGAGLLITGPMSIDQVGGGAVFLGLFDERFVPGQTRLVESVHQHGARVAAQLMHAGKYLPSFLIDDTPVSASAIRSNVTGDVPRALTRAEIAATVEAYAAAAERAKRCGYDGVEILAATGYLISQFLSPVTNVREDEYGGSLANRARFGCEVIAAVRERVGPRFPVWVRVAGADFVEGGHTNAECSAVCGLFKEAGIDAVDVTGGWHETRIPQISMGVPRGAFVYLAARIRRSVGLPVIASNRLSDPVLADRILSEGLVDAVNMGRPLIADPDLPRKARNGRLDHIRRCIACNQGCFDLAVLGRPATCMINPEAGREHELEIRPAALPKRVLVIGGGPAGMEAASVAARRGHRVTLYERDATLGGQLRFAHCAPGRREVAELVRYLAARLQRSRVTVHTETEVTRDIVAAERPDAVVLATGAVQSHPPLPGIEQGHVAMAWDVLGGAPILGQRVVVIGGGAVGVEVALKLAHIGTPDAETVRFLLEHDAEDLDALRELVRRGVKDVTLIEQSAKVGRDLGPTTRWIALDDLERHGVTVCTSTLAAAIEPGGVAVEREGGTETIPADTVVVALGVKREDALLDQLEGLAPELYIIGDAKHPRKALDALSEGFDVGRTL